MFQEIIRATIIGALPIAIFTFLTLQWSISSGRLGKFTDQKDLKEQFKKVSKEAKEAKKKAKSEKKTGEKTEKKPFFRKEAGGDFLHGKIMSFGGGFYGTMALFTYVIIEVVEITQFFGKIIDFDTWTFRFSFQFLIDLIVNSIMNLVAAFIWFMTLPDYISMDEGWVWLAAAYLGYLGGLRFTQEKGDEAWLALVNGVRSASQKVRRQKNDGPPDTTTG